MSFLRRHRVLCFFVLAYVLAWGAIPWNSFFAPGALLAAVIVVAVTEGLPGLRQVGARLIRWRVNWVWYALAIARAAGCPLRLGLGQRRAGRDRAVARSCWTPGTAFRWRSACTSSARSAVR